MISETNLGHDDELPSFVELGVPYPTSRLLSVHHDEAGPGQSIVYLLRKGVMTTYKVETNMTRRAVAQRDDDVLTPAQVNENWAEIEQTMMKELQTWARVKCCRRKPRTKARNIIETRCVHKHKWDETTVDASNGTVQNSSVTAKKIIRSRLTVRGFKDVDKWDIDRHASIYTRGSQKLLVSDAAARRWRYNGHLQRIPAVSDVPIPPHLRIRARDPGPSCFGRFLLCHPNTDPTV